MCVPQVQVLQLEAQLQRERERLGGLRKRHYELAGVAEGWEEQAEEGESSTNTLLQAHSLSSHNHHRGRAHPQREGPTAWQPIVTRAFEHFQRLSLFDLNFCSVIA